MFVNLLKGMSSQNKKIIYWNFHNKIHLFGKMVVARTVVSPRMSRELPCHLPYRKKLVLSFGKERRRVYKSLMWVTWFGLKFSRSLFSLCPLLHRSSKGRKRLWKGLAGSVGRGFVGRRVFIVKHGCRPQTRRVQRNDPQTSPLVRFFEATTAREKSKHNSSDDSWKTSVEYDIVLIRFSVLMSLETRQFSLTGLEHLKRVGHAEGYVIKIGIITGSKIKNIRQK